MRSESVVIGIRLTPEARQLGEIKRQGGYSSRNEVARSMIRAILVDERISGKLPSERGAA